MKKNVTPVIPRCGICKKLYSSRDEDGSGLCVKCRPANSQPILALKRQFKQTIFMEVGKKMMDDFEQEDMQDKEVASANTDETQKVHGILESQEPGMEAPVLAETSGELKNGDIIEIGRYGVSNSQMIPALKKVIAEQSIEKLALLSKLIFTHLTNPFAI